MPKEGDKGEGRATIEDNPFIRQIAQVHGLLPGRRLLHTKSLDSLAQEQEEKQRLRNPDGKTDKERYLELVKEADKLRKNPLPGELAAD